MGDLKKAGWYLAVGNVAVFALACGITLLSGNPGAVALMG